MRDVLMAVQRLMLRGVILHVEKTKWRQDGGKQVVTVGPYREAVTPGRQWAMFTKQDRIVSPSAFTIAQEFIAFVGRDLAWEACQHAERVWKDAHAH